MLLLSGFELYSFIINVILLIILLIISIIIITILTRLYLKSLRSGILDEEISSLNINKNIKFLKMRKLLLIILDIIIFVLFILLIIFKINNINYFKLMVVKSSSMEIINENNTYLITNNLNNQINKYDLIYIDKLPSEEKLNLYDIIIYKDSSNNFIIHRIISIEYNEDESTYYYELKGDSNQYSDANKITYNDMIGIYKNIRIKYIGSLLLFLSSPLGFICITLILISIISILFINKLFNKEINKRLVIISKTIHARNIETEEENNKKS